MSVKFFENNVEFQWILEPESTEEMDFRLIGVNAKGSLTPDHIRSAFSHHMDILQDLLQLSLGQE